ncbi:zinc-ribbon domain-containing protein [Segniliparus rugosus]|uniref:zinc-ribbon domain-containing protein n=1 Tax=Segniliparus rugosus TaxID=286804 RepID=UPI000A05E9F1
MRPLIAAEWHPTKNGTLTPADVTLTAPDNVWWQCSRCGKAWQGIVSRRVNRNPNCRKCVSQLHGEQRRKPLPGKALADTHPTLALQWHPSKNPSLRPEDVTASSGERPWWKCPVCDREWQAIVWARTRRGHGCKSCATKKVAKRFSVPAPGSSLADKRPELMPFWDVEENGNLKPTDLTPSCHTRVRWKCPRCGRQWLTVPGAAGVNSCVRNPKTCLRLVRPGKSLAEKFPEIASQWHPVLNEDITPEDVHAKSEYPYWWQCEQCNREWQASPERRTKNMYLCKICKTTAKP